jgi:hypothetical protein
MNALIACAPAYDDFLQWLEHMVNNRQHNSWQISMISRSEIGNYVRMCDRIDDSSLRLWRVLTHHRLSS